ncbi:MAG: exodeoxyribonuclease V subunit gamma [Wigglesworthia glossinidia]|nr:exodeoxyribonuclease V subunit gamma [Wigglesworthia glossinidia]
MQNYEILNPIIFPIQNTCLIEASAGTGKTHSIVIFYLRLLLGLNKNLFLSGLTTKEILVVTYTEAAKNQLKNRIRQEIFYLKLACINHDKNHPLVKEIKDLKLATLRLITAEKQIDEASIFTIHGFCHRMLNLNFIESGYSLNSSLLDNEYILYQKIFENFWYENCEKLPINIIRIIFSLWKNPQYLLRDIHPFLKGKMPKILNSSDGMESIEKFYRIHIKKINSLKNIWKKIKNKIQNSINSNFAKNKKYGQINLSIETIETWISENTENFYVPLEFKKLQHYLHKLNINCIKMFKSVFFDKLYCAYQYTEKFKQLIFIKVIISMRKSIEKEKYLQEKLEFDDLLKLLKRALYSSCNLSRTIRNYYPVAMIDEFQDTNKIQYKIFFRIYHKKNMCALILIGDPKQAIYGFRGADIFTYMQIKKKINTCYSLETNWRSSRGMINAINCLFQRISNPFTFKHIKYNNIKYTKYNCSLNFIIEKKIQPSLEFLCHPSLSVNLKDYQIYIANQYAIKIQNLLYLAQKNCVFFTKEGSIYHLTADDITILVRNRYEANIMQEACNKFSIPNIYLSDNNNLFHTFEAKEILQILEGILYAENIQLLKQALSTKIFRFEINQIHIDKNMSKYYQKFIFYRNIWEMYGIKFMLNKLITCEICYFTNNSIEINKRSINNILYISEILQEISKSIRDKLSLLRWISAQINLPKTQNAAYKVRINNNSNIIKIMTIFKAKGLEFPIVILPFLLNFRQKNYALFHNKNTYQLMLDLDKHKRSKKLTEQERLSEDLRLTYVALTRSIYHCSVGICALFRGNTKKNQFSHTHLTSIGYLIQKRKENNFNDMQKNLKDLSIISNGDIFINSGLKHPKNLIINSLIDLNQFDNQYWNRKILNSWKILSYSDLKKDYFFSLKDTYLIEKNKQSYFSPHKFPRGKVFGNFIHKLFELISFNKPLNINLIKDQLTKYEIDISFAENIMLWMKKILYIHLNNQKLFLAKIKENHKLTELKFFLSINSEINAQIFNELIKKYDVISQKCPDIQNIHGIKGILTGSIDLIFLWKNKYYFIDYKSNWLGDSDESYNRSLMEQEIIRYRYDLQYQIYTLALHRYLKNRLKKYDYNKDFGGIYYLFLRGINNNTIKNKNGIYFFRPNLKLINSIDKLFLMKE